MGPKRIVFRWILIVEEGQSLLKSIYRNTQWLSISIIVYPWFSTVIYNINYQSIWGVSDTAMCSRAHLDHSQRRNKFNKFNFATGKQASTTRLLWWLVWWCHGRFSPRQFSQKKLGDKSHTGIHHAHFVSTTILSFIHQSAPSEN